MIIIISITYKYSSYLVQIHAYHHRIYSRPEQGIKRVVGVQVQGQGGAERVVDGEDVVVGRRARARAQRRCACALRGVLLRG